MEAVWFSEMLVSTVPTSPPSATTQKTNNDNFTAVRTTNLRSGTLFDGGGGGGGGRGGCLAKKNIYIYTHTQSAS
jgi:hypothetical protein